MQSSAETILLHIIERAIEQENIPVPAIWKSRIEELCLRVVHKLITAEATVVAIAAKAVEQKATASKEQP